MLKTLCFLLVALVVSLIALVQWLMWGKTVFNLYTLCLFIGFTVGFATAYSAVIWPPKEKTPTEG